MEKPSKLQLLWMALLAIASMVLWLYILQLHNLREALIVSLGGLTGISGTLFFVGLVMRKGTKINND